MTRSRVVANPDSAVGTAIVPEWIVCHASERFPVDGVVVCPDGIFATLAHCLECRFLEEADGDRDPERSCSVDSAAVPAEHPPQPPLTAWTDLIIELL